MIKDIKKNLFFLIIFTSSVFNAQNAISGHITIEEKGVWGQKVFLSKVNLEEDSEVLKEVAWSPIAEDGTFSFKRNYIADKDAIYRLYVERVEKVIRDTITSKKDFIISNTDEIIFPNGLASNYRNSNKADTEWLKFREFQEANENDKLAEDTLSEAYATKLKAYTKDSLKILMVKLIGVQQLAKKGLLEKDISKNPAYYLSFLSELKESDMHPTEYEFLSKRLAYLTQDIVEQKYQWSRTINIVLLLALAGLSFLVYRLKKNKTYVPMGLSKQERNIQNLILAGKSNKEIANELFISLSTVKTHITNIYGKLRVSNRQELLQKAQNS